MLTLLASAAAAAALALSPVPTTPAGHPELPCSRAPYGTTGCEAYLGSVVRQREGLNLPNTSDYLLGRAVRLVCFGADHEADLRLGPGDQELRYNIRLIQRRAVPEYCG